MNNRPLERKRSYFRARYRSPGNRRVPYLFRYRPCRRKSWPNERPVQAPPFSKALPDPANTHFQFLEHLATGYWQAEILFAALELQLFDYVEQGPFETAGLARLAGGDPESLERMLNALADLELIHWADGCWYNRAVTRRYLLRAGPGYMGDFLSYRRYLMPRWAELRSRVTGAGHPPAGVSVDDDYEHRNFCYVRATDQLVRRKAEEIAPMLAPVAWRGPVLDIGGGAGSLARRLLSDRPRDFGIVMDLPEVVAAARQLYRQAQNGQRVWWLGGDFRFPAPFKPARKFGLIVLSNFLHAYGPETARQLLARAVHLLAPDGHLLIHDYFPDLPNTDSARGGLHDLNMMLNTFDGVCHRVETVTAWLKGSGLSAIIIEALPSDSGIIIAANRDKAPRYHQRAGRLAHQAIQLGFRRAVEIDSRRVVTAPWVRAKCRFGCGGYGRGLQCPPHTRNYTETRGLLNRYRRTLLVEGEPPGAAFHEKLLALEKAAFIGGYHRVLAFGAGPCPVCKQCDVKTACRFPKKSRPSMEASGMDVYQTVRNAGLSIHPVKRRQEYVKYFGLLLLE